MNSRCQARIWVAGLVLASLAGGAAPAAAAEQVPPAQFADPQRRPKLLQALPQIEALMARSLQDVPLPGLGYAVIIDGDVVLEGGLGRRDAATPSPVDTDSVFRIASMSKSFTALAVLKLRDAGRLRLDDPVAQHVPELLNWPLATADAAPVTVRQLLAHAGGLPEDNPQGDRQLALSPHAFSAWLRSGVPQASAPGSAFEYSNLGYMLLGRLVTQVAGRPYQDYIRDEILQPLGMQATVWSPAAVPAARLALGHRPKGDGWEPEPLLEDGAGGAMGGLLTTPRDLARFVAAQLAAWPPRDGPEAPPALRRTLREMQSGQGYPELWLGRRLPGGPVTGIGASYGFGLQAEVDCRWGRSVGHSGGLPGFGSDMVWLPDHGVAVIVLTNRTYAPAGRLTREALRLLHATGALQPRQARPAAALQQAASATAALLMDWSDARAYALAADNLFLDQPLAERRKTLQALREGLGRCSSGALQPENALRGTQRLDCEQGWIDIELTVAPVAGARVQFLEAKAGRPLQPGLRQTVDAALAALVQGAQTLRLAPSADRGAIAAVLENARMVHGRCQLTEVLEGDGESRATVALACERGLLRMSLSTEQGRLSKLALRPDPAPACLP